ncbi:MAG: MFS transporter permease [Leucobacter sp.]
MLFRRAVYRWMFPASLVLPLWLLVGWGVFQAGGWAFLWVLFIAMPSVFLGQLGLALLVRARPSVAESRAVSRWDAAGFIVWHGLVVAVGFYLQTWFALLLIAAIIAGLGMYYLVFRQLRTELRSMGMSAQGHQSHRETEWIVRGDREGAGDPQAPNGAQDPSRMIIVTDAEPQGRDRDKPHEK